MPNYNYLQIEYKCRKQKIILSPGHSVGRSCHRRRSRSDIPGRHTTSCFRFLPLPFPSESSCRSVPGSYTAGRQSPSLLTSIIKRLIRLQLYPSQFPATLTLVSISMLVIKPSDILASSIMSISFFAYLEEYAQG